MKILVALVTSIMLTGCATTVVVTKNVMPSPPTVLMVAPVHLSTIVPDRDGSVDPKAALGTITSNNIGFKQNQKQLEDLEQWILDTQNNIKNGGKPK